MREHVAGIKASSAGDEFLWREVGHEDSTWPGKASYVPFTNKRPGLQAAVEPPRDIHLLGVATRSFDHVYPDGRPLISLRLNKFLLRLMGS